MNESHSILVVEDEPATAQELAEALGVYGHQLIQVGNARDAKEVLDRREVCLLLLDLQINHTPDSIRPRVEAGQEVLDHARRVFPGSTGGHKPKHLFQVVVMSGHAKGTPSIIRSIKDGADDFILKPFEENEVFLRDRIRQALHDSGRQDHSDCLRINGEAAAPREPEFIRIDIPDRLVGGRREVVVGGQPVLITEGSFIVLLALAAGRSRKGGWVEASQLSQAAAKGCRAASRLGEELKGKLPEGQALLLNNRRGGYRLHPSIRLGQIDWVSLRASPENRIAKLAARP